VTSPLYSQLRATAAALLGDKGQVMTLTKSVRSSYDPATGNAAQTSAPTYPVTGAVFDVAARDIDGTLIKAGDRRVILSALGLTVEPTSVDTLTIGAVVHSIVQALPINPAGVVVAWKLVIRR